MKKSPKEGPSINELSYLGTGNYNYDKKYFTFHFIKDSNYLILPYLNDSISCNFSTDQSKKLISIQVNVIPQKNISGGEATISIETPTKIYNYSTKKYSKAINLPANTIINSIKIYLIAYDERTLPYNCHFNNLKYNYYLKDSGIVIKYAAEGDLKLKIRSKEPNGFLFEGRASLLKTDQSALSALRNDAKHNENLRRILEYINKE